VTSPPQSGGRSREATAEQALADLNVVCLSAMGPVPFATMLLGDLGARVTRVDRPGRSEPMTGLPQQEDPRTRGHRGIGLVLRSPADRETFVDWDGIAQPAPAPRLSASAVVPRPRSRWCGDTEQILGELGYVSAEVAALRADGAVA
jgi:crotonobetainyl-CoA:carnitine CoA-transferase CaiB-like acyl-CoA transferase